MELQYVNWGMMSYRDPIGLYFQVHQLPSFCISLIRYQNDFLENLTTKMPSHEELYFNKTSTILKWELQEFSKSTILYQNGFEPKAEHPCTPLHYSCLYSTVQ